MGRNIPRLCCRTVRYFGSRGVALRNGSTLPRMLLTLQTPQLQSWIHCFPASRQLSSSTNAHAELSSSLDKISIQDLEAKCLVGVLDEERAQPQKLLISMDLIMNKDLSNIATMELDQTIDYAAVCQAVTDLTQNHNNSWKLIETLATVTADLILREFQPEAVTVEVKKFILPNTQWVSAQVTRQQRKQSQNRSSAFLRLRDLPFDVTPQKVMEFLEGYNPQPNTLVFDLNDRGRLTGEAIVEFQTANDAKRACKELNGLFLGKRYIELFHTTHGEWERVEKNSPW
mmetsp:Transcript_9687/g.26820  ORF Transcript_9687/g.26820 Transcript_9687/m.26820 type:complete len:286 (-) Transcript_9687:3130-3987(-)